jgi:phage-related protein
MGPGVLEVVSRFDHDTYRAFYTVRFAEAVYVLHAFQKKSKRGIATPQREIELVRRRLRAAEEHYQRTYVVRVER